MIAVFLLATLLPYLAAAWFAREGASDPSGGDRRRFDTVILGTGGLYAMLHGLTFAGILSVPAVAACGALGLVLAWFTVRQRGARPDIAGSEAPASAGHSGGVGLRGATAWAEVASTLAVAAVCAVWLVRATASLDVTGTDAAHYHVPHAVNYALGASPWGPMPTRHGYPMGTSLLFAWFILPFGDAFVIDASMILWYLLLLVSLAAVFTSLTGRSGWAWTPWLALLMAGWPLIRTSAYPSADLPYAASFLAVAAQLTWTLSGTRQRRRDWVVLGAAIGLLIGCKVSGLYSAATLVAAAALVLLARRPWRRRWRGFAWTAPAAVALLTACATGGVWLFRNAWLFGQPVETFADRYYFSIAQDVRTVYGGDWTYTIWRTSMKVRQWLSPHLLWAGLAIAWTCLESGYLVVTRQSAAQDRRRLAFIGLMAAVAAAHVAGLLGAPWTSLERTGGLSLRYLLPFWFLYPLLAGSGLFSRLVPWQEHRLVRRVVWLLWIAGAAWMGAGYPGIGGLGLREVPAWPAAGVFVAALALCWAAGGGLPHAPESGWRQRLARVGAVVLVVAAGANWLAGRHGALRADAAGREHAALDAWMAGAPPVADVYRQPYLDARADEIRRGEVCGARRFFLASRFDMPLALQPATFTSLVYDAWSVDRVLPLIRREPNPPMCDYLVVRHDERQRPLVRVTSSWLRAVHSPGDFTVFRILRPQADGTGPS